MNKDFSYALQALKEGACISREGWNGKGMWLQLQKPDEHSQMTLPYVYLCYGDNRRVPWAPSQTDLLANDWIVP
jgi:hypothetical protein